jgi:CubicO group peptidase (beta-lactamase class C family)
MKMALSFMKRSAAVRFRQGSSFCAIALAVALEAGAQPEGGGPAAGDLGARLDAVAKAAVGEGFNGVVLVAKGGEEIFAKGYGLANVKAGTPFTPDTLVQIGSNVKDFTKVAIFQLVEAGKLSLDDPIVEFFPDAPADKRSITIDQLLDHRSGLPIGFVPDRTLLSRDEFLRRLWTASLEFAPGSSERYSNAGYSVLAAVIEKVTGESYDDYVARAILRPAGLRETGYLKPRFDPARLAHGYDGGEDQGTMLDMPHYPEGHGWALRGNGGYLATARDQLRFFRTIGRGELLREPAHRARVFPQDGPVVLAGSDNVCFFLFASYPHEGIELVVASNRAEFPGAKLLERIEPLLGVGGPRRTNHEINAPATPVTLADTGPGRTVAAWLAAYATGDDEVMRRFYSEHAESGPDAPPAEKRLQAFHRMRGNLGELTPVAVRETPEGLELTVRTAKGERADLTFLLEAAAPFRLKGIRVMVG